MTQLLPLILTIFLLMAVGFVAVRTRFIAEAQVQALGVFVLNFALPALILNALLRQDLRQTLNWSYIAAYALGSLAAFGIAFAVARVVLRRPLDASAIAALGASAANSGFVGFPVAHLALGAVALTALPLSMLVENILIIPLALALAEMARQQGQTPGQVALGTVRRLSRSPLILAILAGAILAAIGVHLPDWLATPLSLMANASVPCALFVVGGTLAGLGATSVGADVALVVAGKLILHPLAVAASFALVGGVPPQLLAAGLILASSPMLTIYPILGARFGQEKASAAALLAATALSFLTLLMALSLILPSAA